MVESFCRKHDGIRISRENRVRVLPGLLGYQGLGAFRLPTFASKGVGIFPDQVDYKLRCQGPHPAAALNLLPTGCDVRQGPDDATFFFNILIEEKGAGVQRPMKNVISSVLEAEKAVDNLMVVLANFGFSPDSEMSESEIEELRGCYRLARDCRQTVITIGEMIGRIATSENLEQKSQQDL